MQTVKDNYFRNLFGLLAITLIAYFAYQPILAWMVNRYLSADTYYSHGFLVPLVSLFFGFQQKQKLLSIRQGSSMFGLILIILALTLHLLGTVLYVFAISGFSILILIVGISLFIFGYNFTKVLWFPLCFLFFMFPLPEAIISLLSFPLKVFAAKAGVGASSLAGIPVYLEGFKIFIPSGQLLVGNPCSGLRSLIAFLAIGSLFAYLSPAGNAKKWVIFLSSIPFALFSNVIRIFILVFVSHYLSLDAAAPDTFIHTGSGLLVFVIGFSLLMLTSKVLEWQK